MSKRLILILALAFVVGLTCAAYAEVQNVKVSGDLNITGISRGSLTLRDNVTPVSAADFGENISSILSQVRVRIDADLTDNVSTTVRLLNERVWGEESTNDTDIDLDLAYATLKEFLYSPLTLTVGRQLLRYGNGLVIGDPDTNAICAEHNTSATDAARDRILPKSLDDLSARKAFDAIKATLNYDPLVVDIVYSKIDENGVNIADDVDLYGANASYAVNKDLNTELYIFQRTRKATQAAAGGASTALGDRERLRVVGTRATYTGIKDLSLGLEGAYQFGDHLVETTLYPDEAADTDIHRKVKAFAIQAEANYALPMAKKYSPVVGASYTYLSGDKFKSTSDNYKGWDPMFEDQNAGTLFNKIFALTNMQIINLNVSAKPIEDVKLALNYYYLRVNQPYANMWGGAVQTVNLSGISGDPTYRMRAGKSLGSEIDLGLTYDYTEDVQFGLNAGAFIPGSAFDKKGRAENNISGNGKTATQVIGSMKVTF
ncbi:MAG: hypothetical protein FJZ16_09155 [Candidatus Omnitrophica bacterium]|nr:hypothetical protein [Candidatus Omnitrophota bacterium]